MIFAIAWGVSESKVKSSNIQKFSLSISINSKVKRLICIIYFSIFVTQRRKDAKRLLITVGAKQEKGRKEQNRVAMVLL